MVFLHNNFGSFAHLLTLSAEALISIASTTLKIDDVSGHDDEGRHGLAGFCAAAAVQTEVPVHRNAPSSLRLGVLAPFR